MSSKALQRSPDPVVRRGVPLAALAAVVLLAATPAHAARRATWQTYSLRSQAPVAGLAGTTTFVRATFLIKSTWKPERVRTGSLRFRAGTSMCRYTVGLSLRTALGAAATPADHVAADLPAAGPYILDSGTRAPGAWRVTRERGTAPIRIHGEYARVAHADAGIVPAGQAAWSSIVASARSRPGGECHSGTWRASIGPGIGDAFATARMSAYARRAG